MRRPGDPTLRDDLETSAPWLIDAAQLLAEPDPGPTQWLVDQLIVDRALVAAVGRPKTTKSYGLLDICISVATGRPAFGRLAVPSPGPVVFVNEESGRAALWRRLDALCKGRAIDPEELRERLYVAANARTKLDDSGWQKQLLDLGGHLKPRLIAFDPLARMKAPGRNESAQNELAGLLEFLRTLRDESHAAVCFVHHTGHQGEQMRGSSDLESIWETRLTWKRDGQAPAVDVENEHREAESGPTIRYRIAWNATARSMRFDSEALPPLSERLLDSLREHGPATTSALQKLVGVRKADVLRTLNELEKAGTTHSGRSGRLDRLGRPINDKVWKLSGQAQLWPVPESGTPTPTDEPGIRGSVGGPPSLEGTPGNSHTHGPPTITCVSCGESFTRGSGNGGERCARCAQPHAVAAERGRR